jgi:hypothetical protein
MLSAAEISATTLACPSMAQLMRSTSSSGARRAYNSPMAINRRPHAAFSAHAADPMASTTPASSSDSNIHGAPRVFMGAFVLFSVVFWCCGEGFGVSALR